MVGVSKGLADLEVGNSLADVHIGGVVLLILADSHWGGGTLGIFLLCFTPTTGWGYQHHCS